MEIKWTLFKDGIPKNPYCFITDFEQTFLSSYRSAIEWKRYAKDFPNRAWSEIPIPEAPNKPKVFHRCESDMLLHVVCLELESGIYLETIDRSGQTLRFKCMVCPFCGYKVSKGKGNF